MEETEAAVEKPKRKRRTQQQIIDDETARLQAMQDKLDARRSRLAATSEALSFLGTARDAVKAGRYRDALKDMEEASRSVAALDAVAHIEQGETEERTTE